MNLKVVGLFMAATIAVTSGCANHDDEVATPAAEIGQASDNQRLTQLFAEDQAARSGTAISVGLSVDREDAIRRREVRRMLDAGEVRSGTDYFHAAFIFQHGNQPDDYLLAHALATTAVAKGHQRSAWIAAATLDRYLHSSGRPQIYGTQFHIPYGTDEPVTQGDYNPALISDAMREASEVPPIEAQRRQLEQYEAQRAQ